jgi:hypothetical protein
MRQPYQPPPALLAVVLVPALVVLLHCQQLLQLAPCWHLLHCWQLQVLLRRRLQVLLR